MASLDDETRKRMTDAMKHPEVFESPAKNTMLKECIDASDSKRQNRSQLEGSDSKRSNDS